MKTVVSYLCVFPLFLPGLTPAEPERAEPTPEQIEHLGSGDRPGRMAYPNWGQFGLGWLRIAVHRPKSPDFGYPSAWRQSRSN